MSDIRAKGVRARAGTQEGRVRRRASLARAAVAALGIATIAATACTPPQEPKPTLTVTASSATVSYGDEIPEITATYSATPTTEATCSTEATSNSPVGVYETTCEGATLTGRTVKYVSGSITINPAPVTVTASSAAITVGDPIPTITATYDGFKFGATTPSVEAVCGTEATSDSPAGSYATSCSGAQDDNYSFNYVDGTLQIGTAVVTVTASSSSATYGQDIQPVTASYSGFQHGETEPAVAPTCTSDWTEGSGVGTYTTSCSGASDPSYSFNYVDGSVEVTPADLEVIASSASFVAGEPVPAITASYSGLVNGDTAPAVAPTCSTDATSASPAGTYTSSCSGASDPNYAISYTNGTVTVTEAAAPVVVTASSATITYGDDIPEVTASYSGFTGGQTTPDTAATCSTTATAFSGVGTYETTCSGAADPNFEFTYTAGSITIVAAQATVTASSTSSTYGSAVEAITASYSGLVNGDTAPATPATCSTDATSASPAGSYESNCSGAADPNYEFSYTPGTVTIDKAQLTVTASDATFDQGSDAPEITATYEGFVNGDTAVATPATCSTNANAASPAGTYASTCSGADDPNYDFTYVDGEVTVVEVVVPPAEIKGYAGYTTTSKATNLAASMDGKALPQTSVAVDSGAEFANYQNLTVASSAGAQPLFCKSINTTTNTFGSCSGGTGTVAAGAFVTDAAPNQFDVYTIAGGAAALSPSSLTILEDVPAAFRGMNSTVTANATNGVITMLPTPAATGTFSLHFGICDAGTATYSAEDSTCKTGEIEYGPGSISYLGQTVKVSLASSDIFQKVHTYIAAPDSVSQGQTFTVHAAAAASSIPKYQATQPLVGEPVVNNASGFGIVFPIPAGMEFVSASSDGGSALSSGKMVVTYCTTTGTGCDAKLTGNYDQTTVPYVKVTIPGVTVLGGNTITMPTVNLTLRATGDVGTVSSATLTEFMINLNLTLGFLGNNNANFDGYPVSPTQTSGTPLKAPPAILKTIEITD